MKYRIRKAFLWLLMTLMVLFGAAGCSSNMTPEEEELALHLVSEIAGAVIEAAEEAGETSEETEFESQIQSGQEYSNQTQSEQTQSEIWQTEAADVSDADQTDHIQETDAEPSDTEPSDAESSDTESSDTASEAAILDEYGSYTSRDDVAAYIHTYGRLPDNFITKKEAEQLGWNSKEGNLWEVAPGMSIGGSHFGNYEKLLPEKKGRKYYECDIDFDGGYRGAKRIIYSNDGLIFYTDDHYESFEQLY